MKIRYILAVAPLLLACGGVNESSVVDASSTALESSSSYVPTSPDEAKFLEFAALLEEKTGHVNHIEGEAYMEYGYMTAESDDYFTLEMGDEFTIDRYVRDNGSGINVRNGKSITSSGEEPYVSQTYKGSISWYKLTDYSGEDSLDTKQTIRAAITNEEAILSLSFANGEVSNLRYISQFFQFGEDEVKIKYTLPDSIPENGEFQYEYTMTSFEDGYPWEKLTYGAKAMVKDGVIVASYVMSRDDMYAGENKPINYTFSETAIDYTQGEYPKFEGELFNPDNFVELEN
ncbi:MAG: hypothetical protein MJ238_02620 [Bacilli bacterium]|nr:hypothetical protein [Bacilli bacterium]